MKGRRLGRRRYKDEWGIVISASKLSFFLFWGSCVLGEIEWRTNASLNLAIIDEPKVVEFRLDRD